MAAFCSGCDTKSLILRQLEKSQLKRMAEKKGPAGEILESAGDARLVGDGGEDMTSSLSPVHDALREGNVEEAEAQWTLLPAEAVAAVVEPQDERDPREGEEAK